MPNHCALIHVIHILLDLGAYLVKPNERQSQDVVYDDVLDLSVLAELDVEVLLLGLRGHPAHPNALGGGGPHETQLHHPPGGGGGGCRF